MEDNELKLACTELVICNIFKYDEEGKTYKLSAEETVKYAETIFNFVKGTKNV